MLTQFLFDLVPVIGAQVDPQRRETALSSSAKKTVPLEETLTITWTYLLAKTAPLALSERSLSSCKRVGLKLELDLLFLLLRCRFIGFGSTDDR